MNYRVLILLTLVCGCLCACKTTTNKTIITHFSVTKDGVDWIVQNNTDKPLIVEGVSGGVNYWETTTHDDKADGIDGPVIVESVAPARFIVAERLVIPPGGSHRFAVEQLRPLGKNESAEIHMSLMPSELNVHGKLDLLVY